MAFGSHNTSFGLGNTQLAVTTTTSAAPPQFSAAHELAQQATHVGCQLPGRRTDQPTDRVPGERMTYTNIIKPPTTDIIAPPTTGRPKAIGFVRGDVSGLHAPRHANEVQRHARTLGYQYVYTVRPSADERDPIRYALGMAAGLGVEIIVVFDLAHVDNQPALICDAGYDLETVSPQCTWARSASGIGIGAA
ncbi:hypothetical protein AB0M45_29190 [Nocardia sp. NPDC051787]|uniref:hypothetical protein n=1 Tax=Nocardia sp. NPDC051787 TaxID=3155415 RepID=UPI00341FE8B0